MEGKISEKTKAVSKKLQKFIGSIADIVETRKDGLGNAPKSYVSKIDGSYLTFVGSENDLKYLLKNGITEKIQSAFTNGGSASLGFNPAEQKWYGWSHRAMFGFGIGSYCKKGDCAYRAENKEDFAESCLRFWIDENSYSVGDEKYEFGEKFNEFSNETEKGVWIAYTYNDKVPNKELRGTEFTYFSKFPEKWGRGEWTAKTIEEAKEMAIDFARSVS